MEITIEKLSEVLEKHCDGITEKSRILCASEIMGLFAEKEAKQRQEPVSLKRIVGRRFVVAGIYEKDKKMGVKNVQHVGSIFGAENKEEAIGKAVLKWADDLPDYSLFLRPLAIEIK